MAALSVGKWSQLASKQTFSATTSYRCATTIVKQQSNAPPPTQKAAVVDASVPIGYENLPIEFVPPTIPGIRRAPFLQKELNAYDTHGKYRVPLPPVDHPMAKHVDPNLDWLAPLIGATCFVGPFLLFTHFI